MADRMRKLGLKVALAGLQSYRSGIQSINKDNAATRQSMGDVAQGSKKLDLGLAALTGGMQALAGKGIDLLLGGFKKLTAQIKSMASEAGIVAGLKGAFEGLTASIGITGDEMLQKFRVATGGMVTMKDAMMSFNKAAQLISTDFATMIPDAMGYLSKVSRATGSDMNYLLDSLVIGIGRLSPMILDNLSIQVSLAEASQRAADMFGVSTKALTKQQKQLGMANIVMEKLARNTAAMPGVTGTVTAQMAAMGTTVKDIRTEIGLRFLPVLSESMSVMNSLATEMLPKLIPVAEKVSNAIMSLIEWFKRIVPIEKIVKGLSGAIDAFAAGMQEALGPVLTVWGNWFSIIKAYIEGIVKLLTGGKGIGKAFSDLPAMIESAFQVIGPIIQEVAGYLTYFFKVARDVFAGVEAMLKGDTKRATKFFQNAFNTALATVIAMFKNFGGQIIEWGKSLIASYSKGIYEGIKTYLVNAIKAVASFIRGFMAPGSPPKFLPNIGTWGAGAMEEYLKGMGKADFSLLSNYTSQFRSELAGLVESGAMGADKFASTFFALRGTVTEVMDTFKETGKVAAGALDILPQKLGKTGEAMAELIEKQLGMQAIEAQLQEVAKQVEEIDKAEEALSSQVSAAMAEVEAGLSEVALQEKALDLELQPFINTLEQLQATEDVVTDELRKQFEAGDIGLEEYEDRVKAVKDQTRAAQTALNLEKANQVEARQALDTKKEVYGLQEDAIRAEEDAQRATLEAQRAQIQEEAAAIQEKRTALAEEIATLESRLAFHRETLEIMKQQKQMMEAMKEAAAAAAGKEEEGLPTAPDLVPDMTAVKDALPTLDELRKVWEEMPSGPAFDLGEMLPDVEEAKTQISEWFKGVGEGFTLAIQNSPIAQRILTAITEQLPQVVEGVRGWIEENFPYAYIAITTTLSRVLEGDLPGALNMMQIYFGSVKDRITTWWNSDVKPILDALKLWWDTNWPIIQAVALTAWEVIKDVFLSVKQVIVEDVWPKLQQAFANLQTMLGENAIGWETLKAVVKIVAISIGAILIAAVGVVTGVINAIASLLQTLSSAALNLKEGWTKVWAGIWLSLQEAWTFIKAIFTGDFPAAFEALKRGLVGFRVFWSGVWQVIKGMFELTIGSILSIVLGFVEGVTDFFKNLYKNLVGESIIPDMLSDIFSAFTDTFDDILEDIGIWVGNIIQWFQDLWTSLIGPDGSVTKMGTDITDAIVGAVTTAKETISGMIEDFVTIGSDLMAGLKQGIKDKITSIKNAVGSAMKAAVGGGREELDANSPSGVFEQMAYDSAAGWIRGWEKVVPKIERDMAINVAPSLMMGNAPREIGNGGLDRAIDQSTTYGDRTITMPVTVINSKVSLAEFKESFRQVLTERG